MTNRALINVGMLLVLVLPTAAYLQPIERDFDVRKCGFSDMEVSYEFKRTDAVEVNRGSFYCEFFSDSIGASASSFIAKNDGYTDCGASAAACAKRYLKRKASVWSSRRIRTKQIAGHEFHCLTYKSKEDRVAESCALYSDAIRIYLSFSSPRRVYSDEAMARTFLRL